MLGLISPNYRYKKHEESERSLDEPEDGKKEEDTPSFLRTQLQINEAKF